MRTLAVLITFLLPLVTSLNILFYFAVIGQSHVSYLRMIVGKLTARGHTVDVVFAVYNELANLDMPAEVRRIYYNRHADPDYWKKHANHLTNLFAKTTAPLDEFAVFHESGYQLCRIAIEDADLFEFLKTGDYDIGFSSDYDPCGNVMMTAAGIPSIGSMLPTPIFLPNIASAGLPTVASVYGTSFFPEHDFSLGDKLFNLIRLSYYHYFTAPDIAFKYNTLIEKRFGKTSHVPDVATIERNLDVIFINSHEFLEKQRPLSQKIKYIGGMGVKEAKELPAEFENILSAPGEFVLFSFGTQVPTIRIPLEIRKNFIEAFKKFPNVTFLWKYDSLETDHELFEDAPNIRRLEWLPQTELLHDPRVKLFISHMGLNSYLETSFAGVPVLAIPLFADQQNNAQNARDREMGLLLDRDQLTVSNLESSIRELLENPNYAKKAKAISKLIKEKPEKPEEVFIRWLELVAANPGLHKVLHLPGAELTPFYYYCGDIILLLVLPVILISFFIGTRCSSPIRKVKND